MIRSDLFDVYHRCLKIVFLSYKTIPCTDESLRSQNFYPVHVRLIGCLFRYILIFNSIASTELSSHPNPNKLHHPKHCSDLKKGSKHYGDDLKIFVFCILFSVLDDRVNHDSKVQVPLINFLS